MNKIKDYCIECYNLDEAEDAIIFLHDNKGYVPKQFFDAYEDIKKCRANHLSNKLKLLREQINQIDPTITDKEEAQKIIRLICNDLGFEFNEFRSIPQ